jgi:hypothetical protein
MCYYTVKADNHVFRDAENVNIITRHIAHVVNDDRKDHCLRAMFQINSLNLTDEQ